ncbi:MAG: lysostaphin resistance A-like protein, partial [Gemmatimonadota bacterium]
MRVALRAVGAVIVRLGFLTIASSVTTLVLAWLLEPFRGAGTFGLFVTALATCLGLLAGTWATLAIFEKRPLAAVGLHTGSMASREAAYGLGFGAAITATTGLVLFLFGWLSFRDGEGVLLEGLWQAAGLTGFVAFAAALEELLFRGYPFQLIWSRLGLPVALGLSAGLFALAHLGNPELTPLAFLNLALAGLLLALVYVKTRSLWSAIGVHAGWNWVLAVPLDQPVSGFVFGMPGYD